MTMTQEHSTEESENTMVNDPDIKYDTSTKRKIRVVSDEELARCMTLEESERLISEKIYKLYHPEE